MAEVTIKANEVSSGRLTLTPNQVLTVAFENNIGAVQVMSDGTAAVFYTVDGSTPTLDGRNTFELPAGVVTVDERDTPDFLNAPVDLIKFISTGSPTVRVQVA